LLNTFEAILHLAYLYLKVTTTFKVILVFGSQKDARNIEQGFALCHKNAHFVREEHEQYQQQACSTDPRALVESKQAIEADGETKKVPLDPKVPIKSVFLGTEMSLKKRWSCWPSLTKIDVFAWLTSDLIGIR
jgi:hypothetical protein